ncbi:uncharacterized protein BT62DRAFT_1070508 [Guyanagaster necrorhizus]|uniref:Uncharacterized protein n=1 Tax=Guyanagaster necrorhizus TaxID=856835 RepID=A0A9P7W600_9AGAR|nr:uncharacterized protein BT62DRAFT_1070508 [Guyanagaster necrorhizus MCA 3950]KAG7452787.1 hypothetical protein BT62DRAFT_1070508 [Guyanagaster necrorhizus MCA 3950]
MSAKPKTLSNGTLSLRFMQNAHRAKQLKEVELEKAQVKDSDEWAIPKEIQESWGKSTSDAVSYEDSYLPFLFPTESSGSSSSAQKQANGRRVFKKGEEVIGTKPSTETPPQPRHSSQSTPQAALKKEKMISLNLKTSSKVKKSNKSAKQAIFETRNVGTDLRPPPASKGFLKPAGVDDPKAASISEVVESSLGFGARERKRPNDNTTPADGETRTKKKKKKTS